MKWTVQNVNKWHEHFAWLPVTIYNAGIVKKIWLQNVFRRSVNNPYSTWWEKKRAGNQWEYVESILDIMAEEKQSMKDPGDSGGQTGVFSPLKAKGII